MDTTPMSVGILRELATYLAQLMEAGEGLEELENVHIGSSPCGVRIDGTPANDG